MRSGENCSVFWNSYLKDHDRKVLFILGHGFDPRMCLGLKMLLQADPNCVKECLLIRYNEGSNSPSLQHMDLVTANNKEIHSLLDQGFIREVDIPMKSEEGRRIGSRRASDAISWEGLRSFDDIVVDISAMPRSIYFPIIAKVLSFLDTTGPEICNINLHLIVPEEITLDKNIQEDGIDDEATYIHGFSSDLVQESTANVPRIWIPVLGEGKEAQLMRHYDLVRPDEMCPVLPSPSVNPRRSDDLISEYREFLFDRLRVEPTNFIYACEWNPFEVYRQIYRTVERYNDALKVLGGCKVVVSALSSKLLSVGALLAAYEAKRKGFMVALSHNETNGYKIQGSFETYDPKLFSLWIAGECYNV